MDIGFYIKWDKYSAQSSGNVVGDELWGESLCKSINKQFKDIRAELYAPNYLPKKKTDVMLYLNDTKPKNSLSNKHILYLQNGFGSEAVETIKKRVAANYDGYIFFAKKLQEIYENNYKTVDSLYLPFGVDTDVFYPRNTEKKYSFECSYIGNDIKGVEPTMKYLYPAKDFDFGLFGNWRFFLHRRKFWKNFVNIPPYRWLFSKITKGKIPQEDVAKLYSSSKINLNCTLQSCIDWNVITLRTYEVLACNGFLITDTVPNAKDTMPDCMVFTSGGDDLKEKITYYLSNEEERKRIAQNGYDYVVKNSSIDVRAKELIKYIQSIIK